MRSLHLAVLTAIALTASIALAQARAQAGNGADGGGAATAPPAEPAAEPAPASTSTAPVAPSEGEGEEPEKPAAPQPHPPKVPAIVRVPVVLKDGMIRIPGGRFTMGSSDRAAPANERPARSVVVPPFWMDKTEVTVGAYRACVDRGACKRPERTSAVCTYDLGDAQLPVSCVSWELANAYCHAAGKRLPAEAEWELAARGSTPIRYPWGGATAGCFAAATLVHEATQRSCAGKRPWKVGSHPAGASPFGVVDMSGNVEEWVADWYAESVAEASPRAGSSHVLRGGGWLSTPSQSKATSRSWGSVREAGPNVGLRCARDDG